MVDATWRPMQAADIDGVVAVAATCFPDHFEDRSCFEERLSLFPQGCFSLSGVQGVKGYLIAYPWAQDSIPPLDSLLGAIPDARDTFYLHDLALHPDVRGQGHTRPAVDMLMDTLRDMGGQSVALVSVNQSTAFWNGMGFTPVPADALLRRKLASYGDDATYMLRRI